MIVLSSPTSPDLLFPAMVCIATGGIQFMPTNLQVNWTRLFHFDRCENNIVFEKKKKEKNSKSHVQAAYKYKIPFCLQTMKG